MEGQTVTLLVSDGVINGCLSRMEVVDIHETSLMCNY